MNEALGPAIDLLERKVTELERNANQLLGALNVLRAEAGLPPRPPGGGGGNEAPAITKIGPDTFYGKRLQTASRQYLEMRKTQGLGPATPREIYEAVAAGGYQFDTKDAETALVGLRAMLRKRSAVFHKLPNGSYGLVHWYEHIKSQRQADLDAAVADLDDILGDDSDTETADDADDSDDAAVA